MDMVLSCLCVLYIYVYIKHHPYHEYFDPDVMSMAYTHNGPPPYLIFEQIRNMPFFDWDSCE